MKLRSSFAIVTVVLAVASSFAIVTVRHGIDRDWNAMLTRLDELEEERLARPTEREALYGETTDDAAWPHYHLALDGVRTLDDWRDRTRVAPYAKTGDERASRDALLAETRGLLIHLSHGAHARDAGRRLDWSDGMAMRIQRLVDVRSVVHLAVASAVADIERGDDVRAVQTLLDAHQLARDLCASASLIEEMIGLSELVPTATTDFLAEGGAARMSVEAKELWLDGLDAVDASLPRGHGSFLGEVELVGREFVRALPATSDDDWMRQFDAAPGWRYGFSWRSAVSDYVERATEIVRTVDADLGAPPAETIRRLTEIELAAAGDPNPLFELALPRFSSAARSRHWCEARLSYLRHALAVELGRTPDEPLDPFGNGVEVEVTDERIRLSADDGSGRSHRPEIVFVR